jgi:NAD(P)-dependent dehydrogenase (short-subunit alcohol dehydrogenase family)
VNKPRGCGLELTLTMFNIVITGASRGIGLATALELARAGHQVVATMRNPAGSSELGEHAAKEKLPIRIETMDVDSDESVKQAFGRILAQGPVDVLVNNAGIERTGSIEENRWSISAPAWRRTISGPFGAFRP